MTNNKEDKQLAKKTVLLIAVAVLLTIIILYSWAQERYLQVPTKQTMSGKVIYSIIEFPYKQIRVQLNEPWPTNASYQN